MHAPQIIFLVWMLALTLLVLAVHGKQKTGRHNANWPLSFITALTMLLWWGGFFDK